MPNAVEPPSESPTPPGSGVRAPGRCAAPPWRPLAGGTDLMVQMTGEIGEPPERVLDIWAFDELRGIAVESDALVIGALTTYTELRQSPLVAEFVPALAEAAATIGAAQIQNRGTLGGNIANASPAGDTLPVLLALGAEIVLGSVDRRANGRRRRLLDRLPDDGAPRRTSWSSASASRSPRIAWSGSARSAPGGRRRSARWSWLSPGAPTTDDDPWTDVRLALGSVAATTIRAAGAESVLRARVRPARQPMRQPRR